MVFVQPSSASVEKVVLQVALIIATTGDKGLDVMLEWCLFEKINTRNI